MKTKKQLRTEILSIRKNLTPEEQLVKSHSIASKLVECTEFQQADKILLYAANKSEVNTTEIHEEARRLGKSIYYPKVEGNEMEFYYVQDLTELQEGFRGIREPIASNETRISIDPNDKICIIMPGAVFDNDGNRIGYGGGYYDKYLQKLNFNPSENKTNLYDTTIARKQIVSIAICYECQIVRTGIIPVEEFDVKYNLLITE